MLKTSKAFGLSERGHYPSFPYLKNGLVSRKKNGDWTELSNRCLPFEIYLVYDAFILTLPLSEELVLVEFPLVLPKLVV